VDDAAPQAPAPVDGDRPAAEAAAPRSRRAVLTAALRAQVAFGRSLAAAGEDVEMHGTVVHEAGGRVVAAYAALGALAALAALLWPLRGGLVLLALIGSGLQDLDNRWSWVRRLVPRDIGRTVLAWRGAATRPADGGPPGAPVVGRLPRRRVLVCLPSDALRSRDVRRWAAAPVALGIGLALLGALAGAVDLSAARSILLAAAGLLGACMLAGLVLDRVVRESVGPGSGGALAGRLLHHLRERPLQHIDLAVAVVGGGALFHDGCEVLIRNHANRLPPDQTTLLAWEPAPGPLTHVARDGRLRMVDADPRLIEVAVALGLPARVRCTAVGRAGSLGWRGLGLAGGVDEGERVVTSLVALLRALDQPAGGRP